MATEIDLFKRRIVAVLTYFDEECDLPWDYVQRTGDGRFEAMVTVLMDGPYGEHWAPRSVGIFTTRDDAMKALQQHPDRVMNAEPLDFSLPPN